MKQVNYLDQSLYTGIQARHIMALSGHLQKLKQYPKLQPNRTKRSN